MDTSVEAVPYNHLWPNDTEQESASETRSRTPENIFDQRFKTRLSNTFSAAVGYSSKDNLQTNSGNASVLDSTLDTDYLTSSDKETVQWVTLDKVSSVIDNSNFKIKYGHVSRFVLLTDFILLGTKKGLLVFFDYNQNIKGVLGENNKSILSSGSITSLAISLDSTYVASGHEDGSIFIWQLSSSLAKNNTTPILSISPLTINDKVNGKEGHLVNKPINHLFFLNKRHTGIVSVDIDGLILFHDGYRNIFGYNYHSHKILGSSDLDFTLNKDYENKAKPNQQRRKNGHTAVSKNLDFFNKKAKSYIFGCCPAPLSQTQSDVDSLNLIAAITSSVLLVISIYPKFTTHIKIGKPKLISSFNNHKLTACLSWYPECVISLGSLDGKRKINGSLAYCFSNVLTIIHLLPIKTSREATDIKSDTDDLSDLSVHIVDKKRWLCDESIVSVVWLSAKIVLLMTVSSRILVIDTGLITFRLNPNRDLRLITTIDAISSHITYNNCLSNLIPVGEEQISETLLSDKIHLFNSYDYTFRPFKKKLFVLTNNSKLSMGTLLNWEKYLVSLINAGKESKDTSLLRTALSECLKFYSGNSDLVRFGLTENDTARHEIIKNHLVGLVFFNLKVWISHNQIPLATSEQESSFQDQSNLNTTIIFQDFEELLSICFRAIILLDRSSELFEQVFEFFETSSELKSVFFTTLESYIFSRQISQLSPRVLKELIVHFSTNVATNSRNFNYLEEMICLLNIKEMDIDLIISLCEKYKLTDSKIYIYNSLLKDYITPLVDFMDIIKKIIYNADYYDGINLDSLVSQSHKVYTYLTYVLTNRQYPLETLIEGSDADLKNIKLNIYYILFNGSSIEWPNNSGEIFFATDNPINEPNFPYLYLLLKYDPEKVILMLNEILEDDFLNEDGEHITSVESTTIKYQFNSSFKINRQYIIEVLVDIFTENQNLFDLKDRIFLSIFILRTYPKYPQFIRVNDSMLDNLIETVCEVNQLEGDNTALKNDCELSLQSLLSIYHPTNLNNELIYYFEKNKFNNLLFTLYQAEKKSSKLLGLWVNTHASLVEDYSNYEILSLCFKLTKEDGNIYERDAFKKLARENFEKIVSQGNMDDLINLFFQYDSQLIKEIYHMENESLKFEFCKTLFDIVLDDNGSSKSLIIEDTDVLRYCELLCECKPGESLNFIKRLDSLFFGELVCQSLLKIFKKFNEFETVLYIMNDILKDYEGSLNELILFLEEKVYLKMKDDKEDFDSTEFEKELWKCLSTAAENCRLITMRDPKAGEKSWTQLTISVNSLLKSAKSLQKEATNEENYVIVNLLKRILQQTFVSLINTDFEGIDNSQVLSDLNSSVFLRIFENFLEGPADSRRREIASVSEVKEVVNEIFFLNIYHQESLKLTLDLYNKEVNRNLMTIEEENTKGISMPNVECLGCGKRIWGRKISNKIFQNWEDFNRKKLQYLVDHNKPVGSSSCVGNMEFKNKVWKDLKVIIFKCGHGYHYLCVTNLKGSSKDLKCVLCRGESL